MGTKLQEELQKKSEATLQVMPSSSIIFLCLIQSLIFHRLATAKCGTLPYLGRIRYKSQQERQSFWLPKLGL